MKKVISFFKKMLKVILWVIISFLLLFIVIAVLIQIPAIQNKIVKYATSYISNKTHTKVEIENINISFPKSIVIQGLYLEDTKNDTLIYAGQTSVNIALMGLFNHEININSFALEDVNLRINRNEKDSLFNYNFLLTAFSDTTQQQVTNPDTTSAWTFSLDNVSMKNIHLHYNDNYAGMIVAANLKQLKLKIDKLDMENSNYAIDEMLMDGLSASVLMKNPGTIQESTSSSILPKVSAAKIQISNTNLSYVDSVGKQTLFAGINQFKLTDASLDLQNQNVALNELSLSKSKIQYNLMKTVSTDTTVATTSSTDNSGWKVFVKSIDLDDNSLAYNDANSQEIKNAFDASHLDYKHLTFAATNLYYSPEKTEISIKKFTATDQNNFSIKKFEADFSMDSHSITVNNLKAKTTNSAIDADLNIKYSSLNSLMDSLPYLMLNLNMKNVSINNSDILYFNPQLISQAFFKNAINITSVSGTVTGPVNNLNGKDLVIKTGVNTILKTDFAIVGLPSVETAYFNFPNLKINSGKQDIAMMAGPSIPGSIELPENISLQVLFKGQMKSFETIMGMRSSYGSAGLSATLDKNENFKSNLTLSNFDLGSLLKDSSMYGPVTMTAETSGHGLDTKTIKAKINVEASQIYLNKYNYHNLTVDGNINGQEFEGKINLNDENAVFDFVGLVNLNPGEEQYKFNLNVKGADLKKLNFTTDDMQIAMVAAADMKGGTINKMIGNASITKTIVVYNGKKYLLDSVLLASINESNKSESINSGALIGIKYTGAFSPSDFSTQLSDFINNYFPFSTTVQQKTKNELPNFNFEIQLHNNPILTEVFFPQLTEFEPGLITGSFDSIKNEMILKASMVKIVYGTTEINNLALDVNSDVNALNYKISSSSILNSQIKFDNLLVDGKLADKTLFASISSIDEKQNKKLLISSQIVMHGANYKITLDPTAFYLMNERWDIATDNYIEIGKQGFLIHHLFFNKAGSQINIASVNDKFNDDLNIEIKNFKLDDISGIIEKDSGLVAGSVDGNILLKRVNATYGIIADATISNLFVRNVSIGDLSVKAENPTSERFDIDIKLSGVENNLTATGYYIPAGGDNSVNIKAAIQTLSLKTVEAFSMGAITEASGNLTGNFLIAGNTSALDVTGELVFDNAFITPAALNNQIQLKHETVQFKKDGIYFNSFTILDPDLNTAVIDGSVKMNHFSDFIFALDVTTKDFLLFNTTAKDNKEFYGRMIIDSKIAVNGPMTLPVINANVKLKKGSNFTFAVPEESLTNDKGAGIVEFNDTLKLNPILNRASEKEKQTSGYTGFDISSIIEIDKQATLRLILDPTTTDSLVVKGEAALSFVMDQSGKMSLTGAYNLNEGSYIVSMGSLVKRKFAIDPGSTIIWNGDPLDAEISINAIYSVRAAPIDLVADQMSGLSEVDINSYKQRYPFLVYLKLRGAILKPEITFEIQLRPEDKGILGGAVNAKLNLLNEDPSALNKQVFALLVLGRFIQENPLQTETNAVSTAVNTTVGKFLSAQLNQLSSKVVPGVEMNFDIQSSNTYQSGTAEGQTQVDIGLKKQLFNERFTVQVGGTVAVEGTKTAQNSASDITSDVTVEYKLTKDGRYRLKGFRHNQYEGAIEGQLVETGAGISYVRDFNDWKEFFKSPIIKTDSIGKIISNDTIKSK